MGYAPKRLWHGLKRTHSEWRSLYIRLQVAYWQVMAPSAQLIIAGIDSLGGKRIWAAADAARHPEVVAHPPTMMILVQVI